MADDPRLKLLDAEKALKQATREAEKVMRVITDAGNQLRHWQNVRVTNIKIPIEGLGPSAPSIDAKQWPNAKQLAEVLAAWHKADGAVLNAKMNLR